MQVHPTLRCNLRCHHCYSWSGPEERAALPVGILARALAWARAEGYNAVGVSGGEPLLYPHLAQLLEGARSLGLTTTVTTNGLLLSDKRLVEIGRLVDLFALSIDGPEESHNRVRDSGRAFEGLRHGLAALRRAGRPFGLIFTLTVGNLDELEEVAAFAAAEGASLLQVHPLEEAGRAEVDLPRAAPDDVELAYAFLEVVRLRKLHAGRLIISLDVASRAELVADPARGFADEPADPEAVAHSPLADLVAPIVIESDGIVVPVQYGFSRRFAIANIVTEPLDQAAARWRRERYQPFVSLCRQVHDREVRSSVDPFFNWYAAVTVASRQPHGRTSAAIHPR